MKSMKKALILLGALTLLFVAGCANPVTEPAPVTVTNVVGGTAANGITLVSSNLGDNLGSLVTHNPEIIATGTVPYLPVLKSNVYNGTTPYLTFTFDKTIQQIFASALNSGTNEIAGNSYIFDVTAGNSFSKKLLGNNPIVISGATVTFNLPVITDHNNGGNVDGDAFKVGNRYMADFFVQTTDGKHGRVCVFFAIKNADPVLGALGPVEIYARTAEGLKDFSLFKIDNDRVYHLAMGSPEGHDYNAVNPATVVNASGTLVTTFNTWETRYANTLGATAPNVPSLEAATKSTTIDLTWAEVANATEYRIYTSNTAASDTNWVYIGAVAATAVTAPLVADPVVYTYYLSGAYPTGTIIAPTGTIEYPASYPGGYSGAIGSYRAVRVVPVNNIQIGAPIQITLADEVHPVTDQVDGAVANSFALAGTTTYANHDHAIALVEGHIVSVGTKILGLGVINQPGTNDEAYKIAAVSGDLIVTTTAVDGAAVLPLTVATYVASVPVSATDKYFQLGANAVGVLSGTNLTVYIHLRCYPTAPATAVSYTIANTPITLPSGISVTYTDLYGNPMISRITAAPDVSKNSGIITFIEN